MTSPTAQSDGLATTPRESVIAAHRALFAGIVAKDVDAVMARYVHDDRLLVFLEGPESKVEGWDEDVVRDAWNALLDQVAFSELDLEDDMRAAADESIGYVAGTIRGRYGSVDQDPAQHRTLSSRGTWVLEKSGDDWLIVTEHVSFPAPDPYPLP